MITVKKLVVKKPRVKLVGEDGNVFNVIGRCSRALLNEVGPERATEFREKAFAAGSYDEVLRLAMEYCEVR